MSQPYQAKYPQGSRAKVVSFGELEAFRTRWLGHHPLTESQLEWADQDVTIIEVGFYHGGDPLYVVRGARGESGYWHEPCLISIGDGAA